MNKFDTDMLEFTALVIGLMYGQSGAYMGVNGWQKYTTSKYFERSLAEDETNDPTT